MSARVLAPDVLERAAQVVALDTPAGTGLFFWPPLSAPDSGSDSQTRADINEVSFQNETETNPNDIVTTAEAESEATTTTAYASALANRVLDGAQKGARVLVLLSRGGGGERNENSMPIGLIVLSICVDVP